MLRWCGLLAVLSGCLDEATVRCPGEDRVCPGATSCASTVTGGREIGLCVSDDQVRACAGQVDDTSCELNGSAGTCHGGGCFVNTCGNSLVDVGEACDDGAQLTGDGCSGDCRSKEQCGNGVVDAVRLEGASLVPNEECDDGNGRDADGCSATCKLEVVGWKRVEFRRPPARADHAAFYDPTRNRVDFFGGGAGALVTDETWAWSGGRWDRAIVAATPGGRRSFAMAGEPGQQTALLFGGGGGSLNTLFADTWRWDGIRWSYVPTGDVHPIARFDHTLVADPIGRRLVLFGGSGNADDVGGPDPLGDTWRWDGTAWQELALPTAPSARSAHAMAFDPVRGNIVLFGGAAQPAQVNAETWILDATGWTQKTPATSPPARRGARLAWDPFTQRLLLFGGVDTNSNVNNAYGDTWAWDGTTWERVATAGPPPRSFHAMATHGGRGVIVDGGYPYQSQAPYADTWRWTGSAWEELTVESPSGTVGTALTFDPDRGRVVAFGGLSTSAFTDEVSELRDGAWTTFAPTTRPGARLRGSLAYHASRGESILFGGRGGPGLLADGTWAWNGTSWRQAAAAGQSPPPRFDAALAYDGARDRTLLFGGEVNAPSFLGDTWQWDGNAWMQLTPAHAPSPRRATFAFDPLRQRIVLFGGFDSVRAYDDTWEWDGTDWIEISTTNRPSARGRAGIAWNPARQRMTLVGGEAVSGEQLRDAWEWDGTTWTPIVAPAGSGFSGTSVVSTAVGVAAFGGQIPMGAPQSDLWVLTWSSAAEVELCDGVTDTNHDRVVGCDDDDCWWRCTPRCPPGTSCPGTPGCGDGTCSALESCHLCADDCGPCAPVCGDAICEPPTETAATCPGDC